MTESWLGWHFTDHTESLRHGDGRKVVVGQKLTVKGQPVLCEWGLHAGATVFDILIDAPGPILFRVLLSGRIVYGKGISCATERTPIARIDATDILQRFARKCALNVIHLWDAPQVVRDYLETGNERLRDAANAVSRAAAWDATKDAAWDAAKDAAKDAAWAAAGASSDAFAWSSAWSSAWDAANAAERAVTWDVAVDEQRKMLEDMVRAAMPGVP